MIENGGEVSTLSEPGKVMLDSIPFDLDRHTECENGREMAGIALERKSRGQARRRGRPSSRSEIDAATVESYSSAIGCRSRGL
jgi:hypothetical protein